jgi:outer membrane protein OmpA-like peptidoglycan-associated protein
VDARSIDLVPLRAYASQFPAVALKSGSASAKGTVSFEGQGDAIGVAYTGSAEIANLATLDTIDKEELLDWKSLKCRGIALNYAPDKPFDLVVSDITVDKVYSRIVVTPEGKLNVQQLRTATPAQAPAQAAQPQAPPAPAAVRPRNVRIDRIAFVDSQLNFTDHFIKPNYTADVGELNGSVTSLSSEPSSRAVVALAGRMNAASPVVIEGTVNPLSGNLFLDIAAKGEDIDLTKLTAYSQRYAGYGIADGRLTLDVKYHVENGKLEGHNKILLDQLTFGDKVESPDATKLPVLFVINLLKDSKGRINLELPISGSLEDPKFELGALIAQMFRSHFEKAETSPFSLLAADAGGNDLAFVEFQPGLAVITPEAGKKLDTLVKVLQDRPGLKLEIAARIDPARDVEALKAAALERKLAALPKDISKEAREKVAQEPITIGPDDMRALSSKRSDQVRDYLVASGRLAPERVSVASSPSALPEKSKTQLSRVDFTLR